MVAAGLLVTSCSFITDFSPANGGNGGAGAGGMSGAGGMGGMSGSGGHPDAHPDARPDVDAAVDAHPDAVTMCVSSAQCNDGFLCTTDRCNFSTGMCTNTDNGYCTTTNQCTIDRCDPAAPMHDTCGCSREFVQCASNQICLADQGCVMISCSNTTPCPEPADCCMVARCENQQCREVPRCTGSQTCVHLPDPQCAVPTQCVCQ
jgi:hypothetical protein